MSLRHWIRAQSYVATPANKVSYLLVHVAPGTDIDSVRRRLLTSMSKVEILTPGSSAAAAALSGYSVQVPAPPCSRVRCLAPSSRYGYRCPKRCIPAPRII